MYAPTFPMPAGYVWQYELIRWLQSYLTTDLERVMKGLTLFGVEWFYILVLPILFWGVNKRIGLRLMYVFLTCMYSNAWMKDFFHIHRPIGVPGIQSYFVATATGASMPSGHAQGAMAFWVLVGKCVHRGWFWVVAMVFVFAIGVSRIFLGVHWPLDILVGWAFGLAFGLFGWWVGKWWTYRRYAFRIRMATAVILPAICLLSQLGPDSAQYAGLLLGVGVGAVFEEHWCCTELEPEVWKRACAVIVGIAGMIALKWLIKWPVDQIPMLVTRDVLIGLWATLGAPYVFEKCGLYRRGEPA